MLPQRGGPEAPHSSPHSALSHSRARAGFWVSCTERPRPVLGDAGAACRWGGDLDQMQPQP